MRPYLIKLLAVLLPACFLVAFAGCVTLCSAHASEGDESRRASAEIASQFAPVEDECCPLQTTDRALLSERSKVKITDTNADMNETVVPNGRLLVSRIQYSPTQSFSQYLPKSPPHLRI